jgi:hypothetical protein
MKRAVLAAAACLAVVAATSAGATAGTAPTAQVDRVATVISAVNTIFDFDLYDCPAGAEIVIVEWTATQPNRPDSGAASGLQPYGLSNGDPVQHLTLITGSSSFLAGEQWVGSGTIACGPVVIPVEGAGTTQSLNGV